MSSWRHVNAARGQLLRQKQEGSLRGISYNTNNLENNIKIDVSERIAKMWTGLNWFTIGFGVKVFAHWDTRWCSWLRKVAGSIPDDVIRFFIVLILSAALWSWDRLLGGKGGRCLGLTTLAHSFTDCLESWKLHPHGNLEVCPGLCRSSFTSVFSFWTL